MSKRAGKPQKKIEDQIKPILEKLTFGVLKNKPDNIVSINNIIFKIAPIYARLLGKTISLWIRRRR